MVDITSQFQNQSSPERHSDVTYNRWSEVYNAVAKGMNDIYALYDLGSGVAIQPETPGVITPDAGRVEVAAGSAVLGQTEAESRQEDARRLIDEALGGTQTSNEGDTHEYGLPA